MNGFNDRVMRILLVSLVILTWLFITFSILGLIERVADRVQ